MTVINSNTSALLAQNSNRMANSSLQTAMERLSTGKRINTAADDAAGYSIASKMTATEKGMAVAIRNANDGVSMIQTANSALDSVTNMLQRMQELATQSANGTLGDSERASLQAETDQLTSQINDIAKTTNFNGINLLDGSVSNLKLQVGTNAGDTVSLSMAGTSASSLGLTSSTVAGQLVTGRVGAVSGMTAGDVLINGQSAFTTAPAGDTAKDLATAINANSSKTGVTATAFNTVTSGTFTGTADNDLKINGDAIAGASSASELVSNINRDAHGVTAALNDDGTITLTNDTGNTISITSGTGGDATKSGFEVKDSTGFVAIKSANGSPVAVTTKDGADATEIGSMGLNNGNGGSVTGYSGSADALVAGDISINGVAVGKSTSGSAASKAAAINAVSSQTGVTASASTTAKVSLDMTKIATGSAITVNGVEVDLGTAKSVADVVSAINDKNTGVVASTDSDGNLTLTSSTGQDISVVDGDPTGAHNDGVFVSATGADGVAADADGTVHGQITLASADGSDIRVEGDGVAKAGLAVQGGATANPSGTLDISSQSAASAALTKIQAALDKVTSTAGKLGALENRMNVTIDNLTSASSNLEDARSRIQDADFSAETTNLAKAQILSQASTAMLAQANQSQQGVLKLLQ